MSDWFLEYLLKELEAFKNKEKPKNWFGVQAIYNVPYIEYDGLTEKECLEVKNQIQNVLRLSRNMNNFNEVSITYRLDDESPDKYARIFGSISSVKISEEILKKANDESKLVVISLHNHHDKSPFSINDISLFCANPCIKLMAVVNTEGKVSYLSRPREMDLNHVVTESILDFCPDFLEKLHEWKKQNPEKEFRLSEIITDRSTRAQIQKESLFHLINMGAIFRPYTEVEEKDVLVKKETGKKSAAEAIPGNELQADEYCDNGEDGYEWEYSDR